MLRPLPTILSATAGHDPHAAEHHAAIYVSYDPAGTIADYVIAQIAALAACRRRITFISNSPAISDQDMYRLKPLVREILHRRNLGHDFGAYKDGIARIGNPETLVLMNDSCYGPFGGLAHVEHAATASGADLFGITDSWNIAYHLQSYYIWIGPAVLRSPAFAAFWASLLRMQPRNMVISTGEIKFTRTLQQAGFTAAALHPYSRISEQARTTALHRLATENTLSEDEKTHLKNLIESVQTGVALNPMHAFWDTLLRDCRAPFLKRDLLRRNPANIPGVAAWETTLAGHFPEDLDAIRKNLTSPPEKLP